MTEEEAGGRGQQPWSRAEAVGSFPRVPGGQPGRVRFCCIKFPVMTTALGSRTFSTDTAAHPRPRACQRVTETGLPASVQRGP